MAIQVLSKEEVEVVSGGTLGSGLLKLVNGILDSKLGAVLGKVLGGVLKAI